MPPARLSKVEIDQNRYNLTEYVKNKYKEEIAERAKKYAQKIEESKYNDAEEKIDEAPKTMDELVDTSDRQE